MINVAAVPRVVLEPLKQVRNGRFGSFDRELLEGIVLEFRTIKERFRLIAAIFEQAGILGAGRLQGLVFLTILMTVGLQGLTAQPLAQALVLVKAEDDEPASAKAAAQTRQDPTESGQQ